MKRGARYLMDPELGALINAREWPGYEGAFTRDECPLAEFKNGTRVEKVGSGAPGDNDIHKPGAVGTVLGSIGHPEVGVAYFVEFDASPRRAIMVTSGRLKCHG